MREADGYTMPTNGRNGHFMMGMLWGAAAGVALGLLLAPSTGAEFRTQIADKAERLRRRASSKFDDVSGAVNDVVEKGRKTYGKAMDTVDDLVDRGRTAVEKGRETFEEAQADAQRQFS
jgi:gas vesicle protein